MPWKAAGPTYRARCFSGRAVLDDVVYEVGGWDGTSALPSNFYAQCWRSSDLMVAELGSTTGLIPQCFHHLVAFDDELILSSGFDASSDDRVSNLIKGSADGGLTWTARATAPSPHEAGLFLVHDGKLIDAFGLKYNGSTPPYTYTMNRKVCHADPGVASWDVVNNDLGLYRRSPGFMSWRGKVFIYGGVDDEHTAGPFSDAHVSEDGLVTIEKIGDGLPPGSLQGHSLTAFLDRAVLMNGYWGGGYTNQIRSTDNTDIGYAPDWYLHPDPPWAGMTGSTPIVKNISGIPHLIVWGGRIDGAPILGAWKSNNIDDWTPLTDSDLVGVA